MYFTSADPIGFTSGAPQIAAAAVAFPPNRYNQEDVARELTVFAEPGFMRFGQRKQSNRRLSGSAARSPSG
jgi:hypothetical protein